MLNEVQKESIRRHLKRVLASSEFVRSERATSFLRFVVTQALDEHAEPLKERIIGIAVFDRPADWDPKLDTTVRTEARRLRKKLEDYYASPAAEDQTIRINIPLGTYTPVFHFVEISQAEEVLRRDLPEVDSPVIANVVPSAFPKWLSLLAVVALCIGLTMTVVASLSRASAEHQAFETVPFASEYGHELSPTIAPDASQIAYVWDRGSAEYRIYLRGLNGGAPRRLTDGRLAELDPAWSPSGRQIAFLRVADAGTDVVVRDVSDGAEHPVGAIATQIGDWTGDPGPLIGNLGPSWSPDEKSLYVADHAPHAPVTGIVRIRVADGMREQLTRAEGSTQDFLLKVSSDGRCVAFVRAVSHGIADIYLLDLKTMALREMTHEAHSINGLAWFGNRDQLVFSSNRQGSFQLWTLNVSDGSIQKVNTDSTTALDPQPAGNGDWIAYVTVNQNWNVDRVTLDAGTPSRVERYIASSGRNHSARFSPDGKHVAFVSDRSGSWEIWLCDAVCSEPQKLTDFHGPWIGGLSWSPDSAQLAFDARPGRNSAIYRLSISHPAPELIEKDGFEERMPSWSRDGRSLYFDSDRDGSLSIWRRDLATGNVTKIGAGFSAREQGAGGEVLTGQPDGSIWIVKPDGKPASKLPDVVTANPALAWTTMGGRLYFCTMPNDVTMRVMEYQDGRTSMIAELPIHSPRSSASLDVSPDGRSLLITSTDQSSSNIYRRVGSIPR